MQNAWLKILASVVFLTWGTLVFLLWFRTQREAGKLRQSAFDLHQVSDQEKLLQKFYFKRASPYTLICILIVFILYCLYWSRNNMAITGP